MKAAVMCDLDGTIYFAQRGGFARGIEAAFADLSGRDIACTVNTARHPRTARALAANLGVRVPYGCLTGGVVLAAPPADVEATYVPSPPPPAEVLRQASMPATTVARVVQSAKRAGLGTRIFYLEDVYLFERQELYTPWPEDRTLNQLSEIVDGALQMFVTGRRQEQCDRLVAELAEMEDECSFYAFRFTGGFEIAVNPPGVTKARLVDYYMDQFGVDRDAIMAIGDSPGDAPMIERAGVGVATALAPPEVKAVADIVLEEPSYDAVPRFLRRYFEI